MNRRAPFFVSQQTTWISYVVWLIPFRKREACVEDGDGEIGEGGEEGEEEVMFQSGNGMK